MTRTCLNLLAVAIAAALLVGCVATDLRVTNDTGNGIYVYSVHTKEMTAIPAGATAKVPHTSGRVIVITQADDVWEHENLESVTEESTKGFKRLSLKVHIGAGGTVTLPSGETFVPTRTLKR